MHGHRRPCRATVSAEWAGGKLRASPTGSKHLSEGWGSRLASAGRGRSLWQAGPLLRSPPSGRQAAREPNVRSQCLV